MIFQAIGMTYLLGDEIILPHFIRDAVDHVAGPTTFFIGATIAFGRDRATADSSRTAWWPGRSSTCFCSTSA